MGKRTPEVVVGYWYSISAHLCVAQGPVDAFTRLRIGDKTLWQGNVTTSSSISIDKPLLFGGEDREGGFVGDIDFIMGSANEPVNSYLESVLGSPMPAFRNRASIVLKQPRVAANNPNIKPISIEVFRRPSAGWYDSKAVIGTAGGVNPVHIVRELLAHPTWGMSYTAADIGSSFEACADTLYNEGFGLSFVWQSSGSILDFASTVMQHIQGALYVDPRTGKFEMKLIRDDYNINTLPVLDQSNIISVSQYERTSPGELVNQVTVLWTDPLNDRTRPVTVHNPATRAMQGGTVATTIEFPGIPEAGLANRVATRELRRLSSPVSRITLTVNRRTAPLQIGDPAVLVWPDLNIESMVVRVAKIDYGTPDQNAITLHCVEDVFGVGASVYSDPSTTLWSDPINYPAPCPHRKLYETPYIEVVRYLNESTSLLSDLDTGAGGIAFVANAPTADSFGFSLYTRIGANPYSFKSGGSFAPTAIITHALTKEVTSTLTLSNVEWLSEVSLNSYAIINDEIVEVTAKTSNTVTVARGILDTVPAEHPINSRIWFAEGFATYDTTQWANAAVVSVKALTTTGKGTLSEAAAPADTTTITRRWYRPYPPGNFTVNGLMWPTAVITTPDLNLAWSHRDRTTQLSTYVKQNEGNAGPEAGVTYTVVVKRHDGSIARTVTGLTGTSYTYTQAFKVADAPGNSVTFELYSVRSGLDSWQKQVARILLV